MSAYTWIHIICHPSGSQKSWCHQLSPARTLVQLFHLLLGTEVHSHLGGCSSPGPGQHTDPSVLAPALFGSPWRRLPAKSSQDPSCATGGRLEPSAAPRCLDLGIQAGQDKVTPALAAVRAADGFPGSCWGNERLNQTLTLSVTCIAVSLATAPGRGSLSERQREQVILKGRGDFFLSDSVVFHR